MLYDFKDFLWDFIGFHIGTSKCGKMVSVKHGTVVFASRYTLRRRGGNPAFFSKMKMKLSMKFILDRSNDY